MRRSRCCDGAAQTSSVALILRVALRRDAQSQHSFPPGLIQISMVVAHSPRPPPGPVITSLSYKLAAPRRAFFASICRANTDPPVTKLRLYGLLLGCRSGPDRGSNQKTFYTMFEPSNRGSLHRLLESSIAIDRGWPN